jgi:hypothetical protein
LIIHTNPFTFTIRLFDTHTDINPHHVKQNTNLVDDELLLLLRISVDFVADAVDEIPEANACGL